MDVKLWFEKGTNLKIKDTRYLTKPQGPYSIYIDDINVRGADKINNIEEHDITIEHYYKDESNEKQIEDFLDKENIKYEKNKEWIQDESLWISVYNLETIMNKKRKG